MSNNPIPTLAGELNAQIEAASRILPAETFATFSSNAKELGEADITGKSLMVGSKAPDFTLPDATGRSVSLSETLAKGPVVLTIYRGGWCPFCNLQLRAYQRILPQIKETGATLIAISPQSPDSSLSTSEKGELEFAVLSDEGLKVSRNYVPTFTIADAVREGQASIGISVAEYNADGSYELPYPGTFVIDRGGIVRLAYIEGDFQKRLEPQEILNSLRSL